MRPRVPATTAWLVYRAGFGAALYLAITTFTLSLIERVDAGPFTLAIVGTTLEVAYSLAEVPTGVLADRYGRRLSIVVGLVVIGVGLALTAVPTLAVVLAAQVLFGVGWTFTSGADVAWITDEVGEDAARPLYASGTRAELLGSVAGLGLGAGLGQVALWLPLVSSGVAFALLALWLARRMPERAPVRAHEDRLTLPETVRRTRACVRASPAVGVVLGVMVVAGLAGEGFDRLWQLHLFGDDAGAGGTVTAVAALSAASLLAGAAAATAVGRRLASADPAVPARLLRLANLATGAAVVLFALAPWPLAAAAAVAAAALRHASEPMVVAWVNRDADPRVRATLNSLIGQAESAGEVAGGPLLGGIGSLWGTPVALAVSGAGFGVAGLLSRPRRLSPRGQAGQGAAGEVSRRGGLGGAGDGHVDAHLEPTELRGDVVDG